MSESQNDNTLTVCSFVSIHYIICECGETFPNEEVLKAHLEAEHPHRIEKKEYTCGLCERVFTSEKACIQHHQRSHTVRVIKPPSPPPVKYIIKPINKEAENKGLIVTSGKHPCAKKKNIKNRVCEVCGKKYSSNAALRYHQRVHTGERPYQCNYCEKAFTMPLFLQIHHRIHTGEKPYQCPHCPKAFGNKAALLRHDRVHTGARPYTCPHCLKSFTQSNSMKLHVHTVHLKLPAPYKSKRRRERARIKQFHTGVRPYTCPHCLKSFTQSNSMKLHVHTVHLKLPAPYKSKRRRERARIKQELQELCEVKTEPEYIEDQDIFYDHESSQGVLYEVVYKQE